MLLEPLQPFFWGPWLKHVEAETAQKRMVPDLSQRTSAESVDILGILGLSETSRANGIETKPCNMPQSWNKIHLSLSGKNGIHGLLLWSNASYVVSPAIGHGFFRITSLPRGEQSSSCDEDQQQHQADDQIGDHQASPTLPVWRLLWNVQQGS